MTMSQSMQRAVDFAQECDKKLLATDPRLRRSVHIIHEEGTNYFLQYSFLVIWKDPQHVPTPDNAAEHDGEWVLVFSEHHNPLVFAFDDLYGFAQFERVHDVEVVS